MNNSFKVEYKVEGLLEWSREYAAEAQIREMSPTGKMQEGCMMEVFCLGHYQGAREQFLKLHPYEL